MKVNTLILSSSGTSLNNIIGSILALKKKNIIKKNYSNITRFIGCSSGSLLSLLMCCNIPLNIIYHLMNKLNYLNLLNLDNLNNLFENMGLFDTFNIQKYVETILNHFDFKKNLTFKELFEKTQKKLIIKTYNLSKNEEYHISYKNFPNMPIKVAIGMSCCVPFIFKPVIYNNDLFIDGAVCGSTPFINKYKNYISITYENNETLNNKNMSLDGYLSRLVKSTNLKYVNEDTNFYNNKRNIIIDWIKEEKNKPFLDFNMSSSDKNKDILNGYKQTMNHIYRFIDVDKQ